LKNPRIETLVFKDIRLDSVHLSIELGILSIEDRVKTLIQEYGSLEKYSGKLHEFSWSLIPFLNFINANKNFTRIVLDCVWNMGTADVTQIMFSLRFTSSFVKTLDIYNTKFGKFEMNQLARLIHKPGDGLISVIFNSNYFPSEETQNMMNNFHSNSRIRILHLIRNNIRVNGYKFLFHALEFNTAVYELCIIDNTLVSNVSGSAIPSFISLLEHTNSLQNVYFDTVDHIPAPELIRNTIEVRLIFFFLF